MEYNPCSGYMAPEYVIHGRFSVKTDVFSFGVLVLEIISGKRIGSFRYGENEEDLLSYVSMNTLKSLYFLCFVLVKFLFEYIDVLL